MTIGLVKINAIRKGSQICTINKEIIQMLPSDPHYWDVAAEVFMERMIADGLLPKSEISYQGGESIEPVA